MQDTKVSPPAGERRADTDAAFLVGVAEQGIANVLSLAIDLGPDARSMLTQLHTDLAATRPSVHPHHDAMETFRTAVAS